MLSWSTVLGFSSESGLREFCELTSLHGWTYCFRRDRPAVHTLGWLAIIAASIAAIAFLMTVNINEFLESTVSFSLESPTVPLTEVFFPAMIICNMNTLRKSFIHNLLRDPLLASVDYNRLHNLIERVYISGDVSGPDAEEKEIIEKMFQSKVYDGLFEELRKAAFSNQSSIETNIVVNRWHFLSLNNITDENKDGYKRSVVSELAAQFRDYEMMPQINFSGHGVGFTAGFNTDLSETCASLCPFVKPPGDWNYYYTMEKSVTNGANNGFQILLDAESYDYGSSISGSEGFVISIVHHLDISVMKHTGMTVQPGQSVEIGVTPALTHTTKACKRRFMPAARQCYFEDEIKLRHFPKELSYRYSMSNCLFEATLQKIEKECNCIPSNFIDVVEGFEVCVGVNKECMNKLIEAIGSDKFIEDEGGEKECLAACEDQQNTFLVTQAAFPNLGSFHRHPDFCIVVKKLTRGCRGDRRESLDEYNPNLCSALDAINLHNITHDCTDLRSYSQNATIRVIQEEVARYARDNMAKVNVYVRDPYVKRYLTEEKITEINFVGTVGGVMGLFSGFSFVSIIEVLYCLVFGRYKDRGKEAPDSSVVEVVKKAKKQRLGSDQFNSARYSDSIGSGAWMIRDYGGGDKYFKK